MELSRDDLTMILNALAEMRDRAKNDRARRDEIGALACRVIEEMRAQDRAYWAEYEKRHGKVDEANMTPWPRPLSAFRKSARASVEGGIDSTEFDT